MVAHTDGRQWRGRKSLDAAPSRQESRSIRPMARRPSPRPRRLRRGREERHFSGCRSTDGGSLHSLNGRAILRESQPAHRAMSTLAEVRFHIYPTDCDMLGHLNHATMLNFLERARWALLEPQIDVRQWAKQDVFSVVRHVDIGYLAQSFPGEDLIIRSGLLAIKRTSYIVRQDVRKLGNDV